MDCSFKSFYFFISFVILLLFIGFESSVLLVQAPEFPMVKSRKTDNINDSNSYFSPFLPFTGGLLISSAHFGAYVCGTDIDYNTIHGLGVLHISKPLKSYSLKFINTDVSR